MNNSENKKNNVFKIAIIIGLVVIIIILLIILFSINGKESSESSSGSRTIMIYMVGSDLESTMGLASKDLEEIKNSKIDDDVNIVIYTGGTNEWHNSYIKNNTIYEVYNNDYKVVYEDKKRNMGDAKTLSDFLYYVYKNYKSDLYDLVFWDHGYGPIDGVLDDEIYNDTISLNELYSALSNSPFKKNKLELIAFDTCLMANIETAYTLKDYANYLAGSEELEIENGWDYSFLSKVKSSTDTISLASMMVDSYFNEYNTPDEYDILSVAVIDLSKINDVVKSLDSLFAKLNNDITPENYLEFVNNITSTPNFGNYSGKNFDLFDLYDMAINFKENYNKEASELLSNLDKAFVHQNSNNEHAYGLNIYFAYFYTKEIDKSLSIYKEIAFSRNYQEFIEKYISYSN